MLRRILNVLGWVGVALVAAALVLLFVRPDKVPLRQGLAVAGLVCVLLYVLSDWREIAATSPGARPATGRCRCSA